LKEWYRVLAPAGKLILKMPDFEDCCRRYSETKHTKNPWFKFTIYGIQKSQAGEPDEAQYHRSGYAMDEMQRLLEAMGFTVSKASKYDGWGTPSFEIVARKAHKGTRVAWVAPMNWEAAQTRIRVLNVDKWLNGHGYASKVVQSYQEVADGGFDIAIVGKGFDQWNLDGLRMLKAKGIKVYADLCEDIYEFPFVKEIVAEADKVICCSAKLAEITQAYNKNTVVIEDATEIWLENKLLV
jgi:hypothetical protein